MKKKNFVLFVIFVGLFLVGIAVGLFGRFLCVRDTKNYSDLQDELFAPDEIATVLQDEGLKQIYVCYNDSSYVNVYTESGKFLWAVSTPYLRNAYFELQDGRLIVYGNDDAYIYDSADGKFIECVKSDDLALEYDWESKVPDGIQEGAIYFDTYQVYKAGAGGTLETIVARPWWYWCFNFAVCWCIGFIGAIGIGIIIFFEKKKDYELVKDKVTLKTKKLKVICNYFRITSAVHIVYAILDIIFGFFGGILCIGIAPLAIHFIVSNIILWNMLDHISASQSEMKVIDFWKTVEIASFVIAFFSVIIAVFIAA